MSQNTRNSRWVWGLTGGLGGLSIVTVVCIVLLNVNNRAQTEAPSAVNEPSVATSSHPPIAPVVAVVDEPPKLPYIEFPPGSVEEACELNDFMPYHYDGPGNPFDWVFSALESSECRSALENYINSINPYLWGRTYKNDDFLHPMQFVVLEEPLTFGKIFADPDGDFVKVQDALSRPECVLQGEESNWELKETCHADALLNYALMKRFCFNDGVRYRKRTLYWEEDNPTPEQDRFMWKEVLENQWVRAKCEEFSPKLNLTAEQFPELTKLLLALSDLEEPTDSVTSLIDLAARLGSEAAGLTTGEVNPFHNLWYTESGYVHGRFSWLLTSDAWDEFIAPNEPPSVDRFLRTFKMLALASARRPDPRDEIKFDWELVARHLCEPPYHQKEWYDEQIELFKSSPEWAADLLVAFREKYDNPKSCQEIVHELRQSELNIAPVHRALDKFEQVALELGVYE